MFSDGRFLPVEVKHMIVTDKITHYIRVNNKLAQGKGHHKATTVLVKKRLRIGRDSSRQLREDKIANPSRLYYHQVREQCKYLRAYVRPL